MPGLSASAQLREIAVRLRAAGGGAMFAPVRAELKAEAQPLVNAAEAAALAKLPHSGGLNQLVASRHVTVSVRTGARTAGVRLTYPKRKSAGALANAGTMNHLTYGHRPWQNNQQIPEAAGWWTDTLARESPKITPRLVAVLTRVAAWIQYGGL